MTVNWKHRIIRVDEHDDEAQRAAVLGAVQDGWILDSQAHGDGETIDLVFRRARPEEPRVSWI